jgi:hypothetical protein
MEPLLNDWEGDFEELLDYEDKPFADPELCQMLSVSQHEALIAGFFLAGRATRSDDASGGGSDPSAVQTTATAVHRTRHSSSSADRLPDVLTFDVYSNEPFERFEGRVYESLEHG